MVRAKRGKPVQKKTEQFDEDDAEAYRKEPEPDKKSAQYTRDQIDRFHDERIANLLARGVQVDSDVEEVDDEEEVMALAESEEEEEEEDDMESDLEGKPEEELPHELAWGQKKRSFYHSDYGAKGKSQLEVEVEEEEEEEEAKSIQKRLAANLSEEDYDLNFFQEFAVEEKEEEEGKSKRAEKKERIVKDLKQMSQKERMKLLKKESPELLELIQDFKAKLTELKDEVQPLVQMVEDGKIPAGKGAEYLKTKQQLYLNYCTNISFYLVLKARRIPAHHHPVIERLLAYRNLINDLAAVDARLAPQFRTLLAGGEKDRPAGGKKAGVSGKKHTEPEDEDGDGDESDSELDEEAALQFYRAAEERLKLKRKSKNPEAEAPEEDGDGEDELEPDDKRGITYQMAKNKGLTPKRKKIDRNPRVKHRHKFKRAIIRRKGQVREVRREDTRYSGEMSGIRAGVKKSTKLK